MPSRTLLWAYYIYQRRGYRSACFLVIGRGKPRIANEQKPDTPLFFCSNQSIILTSPNLGVWRTITHRDDKRRIAVKNH